MSQTYKLAATTRDLTQRPADLRADRKIPAVCYGNSKDNTHLTLGYQDFRKLYKEAGESSLVELSVDGGAAEKVLVHSVDYDPLTDAFQHVDFLRVNMKEKITTHVPVHFEGVAPAVKDLGGFLTHGKTEIEIRCLPTDLLHDITVDISSLTEYHSHITVGDLPIDRSKIEVLDADDVMVATVLPPKTTDQIEAELASSGDVVSADVKAESEAEKAAAAASKESDKEKKGPNK